MHMKLNHVLNLLVLGSALTITGFGCKTHPERPIRIPGEPANIGGGDLNNGNNLAPANGVGTGITSGDTGIAANPQGSHNGWTEDASALQSDTVYFDFDKSAIKSSEQSKLNAIGDYLKANSAAAVRVEGNCDARGTEEYNRSLGERRADAAREYLVQLGIDASRVDTRSNGEDKPAEQGTSEEAYAKNRRDEFIVLTSPKP
jgi:peptidoglycan-associated lipoprotein